MRPNQKFSPITWLLPLLFIFVIIRPCCAYAAVGEKPLYIPDTLKPWQEWVLHGKEKQRFCVPQYNNSDLFQCAWPTTLEIRLNDRGGTFTQTWLVNTATRVALPGSARHWPGAIRVDGRPKVVLEKNNGPGLLLDPGTPTVTGKFSWARLPENLKIPVQSGLVTLSVNNTAIRFPDLDSQGRLWLKRARSEEKIENRLKIDSFRLINDAIPARMTVHLTLDIAGSARQITLGPVYAPEKFTPLSLKSALPARLEQDGRLHVQVRPGRYVLRIDLRHSGPLKDLNFTPPKDGFWPGKEIWSFKARPDLRLVEIQGVAAVDPLQTAMPKEWQGYPAYMLGAQETMTLKEIKRGDPQPAPDQLKLDRDIWLRFDGAGYTLRDKISGKKNTNWRLEMNPAITLGSALVDGREQLITQRMGSDKAGIELRNGQVNFTAESIYDKKISTLPATGWDHDFQQVRARLHLPPGWKLINAGGMDKISRTWIKQWTLLDFFVVLIFTIALARLYSKPLAGIAFVTLVLIYHEPNAPRYVWPVMLTGFALLKYLPQGSVKNVVKLCQGFAVLAFIAIVIPYSIQALRIGVYPQLEQPWTNMSEYRTRHLDRNKIQPRTMDAVQEMASMPQKAMKVAGAVKRKADAQLMSTASVPGYSGGGRVMQYDPKAITQTGPGMPGWRPFHTVTFSWSGPVTRDQAVGFTLIGPKINMVLSFVRVFFIILLALGMFGIRFRPGSGLSIRGMAAPAAACLILMFMLAPSQAQAADIPSRDMLNELERRLLEKEDCFPSCADIPEMKIQVTPEKISITARVDAQVDTALPLPGHDKNWLPARASIDGQAAKGLFRQDNKLWIMVPKGRRTMVLEGPVRKQNTIEIPFNLKPRQLAVTAAGWSVEGTHPDGSFDGRLQFKRILKQDDKHKEILETGILPPFARVERTLLLGLVWKVRTRVQRISPVGSGMVMDIPLLPGESVTTEGIRVENKGGNRVAKVNFRANQTQLTWDSFLDQTQAIHLEHGSTDTWTEIWQVDISPIFHMEYEGIPVILHKTGNLWYPTWHPWPGEQVDLKISRPAGVGGQTLTIEKSQIELWPGRNTTKAQMTLELKSSQGGQHTITLPRGASLQEVNIGGRVQPIRQNGTRVTLPVIPGNQIIRLTWMDSLGMSTRYTSPTVDLGSPSVNAGVDIHLPGNRWPLFIGGDQLVGPAVLFWSVIIIVFLVAFGLSRTGWTPLNFFHWFLLCIGLSMSHLGAGILVAAWLVALDFRKKTVTLKGNSFNLAQIGIVALTLAAVAALVFAISNGLLGHPDMNIRGNGSTSSLLRWYHDAGGPILPRAWIISIPMLAYRLAMLAWALWVSFWLVGILKWGWQQFTTPEIWQKVPKKTRKEKRNKRRGMVQEPDNES